MRAHWVRINLFAFALAVLPLMLLNGVSITPWFENRLQDMWFRVRGPLPSPENVAVVVIDHESFQKLGLSPFKVLPRKYLVELLLKLKEAGVKGIGVDLVFRGESDDPEADLALEDALARSQAVIASDQIAIADAEEGRKESFHPAERFSSKARGVGAIRVPISDGSSRRFYEGDPKLLKPTLFEVTIGADAEMLSKLDSQTLINFYGPARTIKTYSLHSVVRGGEEITPDAFKDRYVFIGNGMVTGTPGRPRDSFITPFQAFGLGQMVFGVEIHATRAANLLDGSYIRRFNADLEFRITALIVFLIGVAALSLRPQWSALIVFGSAVLWATVSYQLFLNHFFLPCFTAISLILPLILLGSSLYYYFTVYLSQQRIRESFGHYVSPEIVNRILDDPNFDYTTETRADVTMMFTDIQGFTAWAEEQKGNVLTTLNKYFSEVAALVLDSEGTVIKFIGDGMFGLWGAPLEVKDAPEKAVTTALKIQSRIKELSASGALPNFVTRVGIHREEVSLGNLGEKRRFDYTAIGKGVNLTARLEELNKELGTSIVVSEAIYSELKDKFKFRPLGKRTIRGMKEEIGVYEVLG